MKKKISIIGVGKLGLCLALNLEKNGYYITGVDVSENYVNSLNKKTFKSPEPYVESYLRESKNILFTTDLSKAIKNDIIFIVVKTPSTDDWKYDHSQIDEVISNLKLFGVQNKRKDLIINCTTFPGYCEKISKELIEYNYYVSYNPEFIAQGSIIMDQINSENVLIGESDLFAGTLISDIYKNLCKNEIKINRMSRTEAEICKLSINCFLTTKISFANMIGDISIRMGCDAEKILNGVGNDSRIGNKYLTPGFGFGGPCFPRDNRALSKCAEEVGVDAIISKATDKMNEYHLKYQVDYFINSNPDKTKPVVMDYITYKKDSVSIEESQQFKYALSLYNEGYKIIIKDEREEVKSQIKNFFN